MQRNEKDGNGNTSLHLAIINNDIEAVKSNFSQGGVNQTIKNNNGENCLHLAARMGHVDIMSVILDYWFDLEVKDNKGNTCLHIAVKENKVEIVKLLLIHWVDLDIKNKDGKTSSDLFDFNREDAASKEILFLLMKAKVDNNLPIHEAANKGSVELVENALKIEPDSINARNRSGHTPLFLAIQLNHWNLAEYLIQQGANVNLASKYRNSSYASTPFCWAIQNKKPDFALLLLRNGAQFHRVFGETKLSPIHLAILCHQNEIVKELIRRRPELINAKSIDKTTGNKSKSPLCFTGKNPEIMDFLLDQGANKDDAVRYAIKEQQEALALKLIERGASFSIHDGIMMGSLPVLDKILDQYSVLESKDSHERTPLWRALEEEIKNKHQVVQLLLGRGADIYAKNKKGKQIIEYQGDDLKIKELLKQADLYHKYQLDDKAQSLKMNYEEKTAVVHHITSVLTGSAQRVALKRALDPQHILHQQLFQNNTFMSFLQPKLDKQQLVDALAKNKDIKLKRIETDYPAVYAARTGDLPALINIIMKDTSVLDRRDHEGLTPLKMAVRRGHRYVISWLLSQGANPTLLHHETKKQKESRSEEDINQLLTTASLYWNLVDGKKDKSATKLTAKEKVAILQYIDKVFQGEKKINALTEIRNPQSNLGKFFYPFDQMTYNFFNFPCVFAAEQGDIVKLDALYEADPKLIQQIDRRGFTPLQAAINANQQDAIQWLKNHGASQFNIRSLETQLGEAVAIGNSARVESLLEKRADPNTMTDGALPLVTAKFTHKTEIINLLLKYGADLYMQENRWGISAATLSSTLEQLSFTSKAGSLPTAQFVLYQEQDAYSPVYPSNTVTCGPNYYFVDTYHPEQLYYYQYANLPQTILPPVYQEPPVYQNNLVPIVYSDDSGQIVNTVFSQVDTIENTEPREEQVDQNSTLTTPMQLIYNSPAAKHTLLSKLSNNILEKKFDSAQANILQPKLY